VRRKCAINGHSRSAVQPTAEKRIDPRNAKLVKNAEAAKRDCSLNSLFAFPMSLPPCSYHVSSAIRPMEVGIEEHATDGHIRYVELAEPQN